MRIAFGALAREQLSVGREQHRFARRDIAQTLESEDIERDGFRRHHVFLARSGFALAENERTDAVRIAEREHAVVEHQRDNRITAARARMHAGDGFENLIGREVMPVLDLDFVREDVEQHFGIRIGVDVAAIALVHLSAQRIGVDQIAVVAERDAVRRIHVERLRLGRGFGTGGRIAAMTDADASAQLEHVVGVEDVADESGAFVQAQTIAVDGGDAGGILTAMLQNRERVVQGRRDVGFAYDADDSAHGSVMLRGEV